jgi:hypothetical protein
MNMKNLQVLDLRSVSRQANRCSLAINVFTEGHRGAVPWIKAGQAELVAPSSFDRGDWRLTVRAKLGVTDFEHDSSYILALNLYGVHYLGTSYGASVFHAMIAPGYDDDFRVPPVGYDPEKLPDAGICTECEKHHAVTKYLPPTNPELFRQLVGKYVEVIIGAVPSVE